MAAAKPSSLVDTRVVYCGDRRSRFLFLDQLAKLPAQCVDLISIDPPFNSNRNYEVFWGETKEKRAFEDRHESTRAFPSPESLMSFRCIICFLTPTSLDKKSRFRMTIQYQP